MNLLDRFFVCVKAYLYKRCKRRLLRLDSTIYKVTKYGNDYGGFNVYDELLRKKTNITIYSFGIGTDLSFSETIYKEMGGANIYAFDPTPKSIEYVKKHSLNKNRSFHFFSYGLSDVDGYEHFYLPINDNYVSGSIELREELRKEAVIVEMRSLSSIVKYYKHNHIDLLKMDIEGSEFKVVESLKDCDVIIDQICIEIHDRFFTDGLLKLRRMLKTMKELGFILISVSDSHDEVTFLRINSMV